MKNLRRSVVMTIIFALLLALVPNVMHAANVTYKGLDDDTFIDTKYSYGSLFWTEGTTVTDIGSTVSEEHKLTKIEADEETDPRIVGGYIIKADYQDTIKIKVSKCALDEDGDLCDVVIEVKDINEAKTLVENENDDFDYSFSLTLKKTYDVFYNNNLNQYHTYDSKFMNIGLQAVNAKAKINLTYYKAGTSTAANINGVAATVYDIDDRPNDNPEIESDSLFKENEGIRGLYNSTIYHSNSVYLQEMDDGIGVKPSNEEFVPEDAVHREGINKNYSCTITQDQKAKFGVEYSGIGAGCGVYLVFVPMLPFKPTPPVKYVDVEKTKVGGTYNYTATQYIPNNHNIALMDINPSFFEENEGAEPSVSFYDSIVITDKLDEDLTINETETNKIKISDYKGDDITDWFVISKENNTVIATVKEDALKNEDLYCNYVNITIPVKVKEGCKKTEIPNEVTTAFTHNGKVTTLTSNKVIVKIEQEEPPKEEKKPDVIPQTGEISIIGGIVLLVGICFVARKKINIK